MKILTTIYKYLLLSLPAVLFFSYYPIIPLGSTPSMNLELSLPLIWLVLFVFISLPLFFANFHQIRPRLHKSYLLILPFPLFLTFSIFWSLNPLRAVLTAGIIWLLIGAIFSILFIARFTFTSTNFPRLLTKTLLISAVIVSLWCWLQCILDLCGIGREYTLMCAGCTTTTFGFPHPNGFAIEPQFMGNLLLAPAIVAVYLWLSRRSWRRALLAGFLTSTLFLTFSRGAIYSFGVAVCFLIIVHFYRTKSASSLLALPLLLISFLFTLNTQGLMAQFSITNDTYFTGISKSLNQLSLGLIDIQRSAYDSSANTPVTEPEADNSSTFDGYVEESTNTRLRLTAAAIDIWRSRPTTILFGVGLGGAGEALYQTDNSPAPKEIVQNEYASLLLETGLIGIILALLSLIIICYSLSQHYKTIRPAAILAILLAYALSLMFFSGLPNALHIYLLPAYLI